MLFKFDKFNRLERPQLILCEISKKRLGEIDAITLDMNIRYTNISEIHFTVPSIMKDGRESFLYDEVKELRMVNVRDYGWFQIRECPEITDNFKSYKDCTAYSAECILQNKHVLNLHGEYRLFDPLKPYESLLGILLLKIPGWKIGNVDSSILTKRRSINISKQNLYALLTSDIAKAYECVFVFDYKNYLIHIVDISKEFKKTSIILSYHNLIKSSNIQPLTDKIITALTVKGGGDLDIVGVNPNGTDTIFNVNYFKNRMSDALRTELESYENKYKTLQISYANLLLQYKNKNQELMLLNNNPPQYEVEFKSSVDGTAKVNPTLNTSSGLEQYEAVRKALDNIKSARIEKGNIPFSDVNNLVTQVESLISLKKSNIISKEHEIANITKQLSNIVTQLKMENNFTDEQWVELNQYFYYDTFLNDTLIWTDIMKQDEKQSIQQELFEYGVRALERCSFPRYKIEIDSVNFLALPEFKYFTDQFELGTSFTLDFERYVIKPLLLEVYINFDDLTDFKLTYANKTMLDDSFSLVDFNKSTVNATNTISFDLVKMEAMKKQSDYVTEFLNGSLITSINDIKSTKEHTKYTFDETGIRLKQYDYETDKLLSNELWLTGSQIVFSDDSFTNAKLALGRIRAPGNAGGTFYGIIGDYIGGRIVASNNLHVSNDKNNFLIDETGCYLTNAEMIFKNSSNANIISIDSKTGMVFKKGNTEIIKMDINTGNASFTGNISGGTINIGNGKFKVDADGDVYITQGSINLGDGSFIVDNLGNLTMKKGSININNCFKVDSSGILTATNVDLTGHINATSGKFSGSINVNDCFTVDSMGNCRATSFNMTGGSINYGNMNLNSGGDLTATNAYIKGRIEADSGYFRGKIEASEGYFNGVFSGQLSSNVVYAGQITAEQITTGILGANVVYAGQITAEQIKGTMIKGIGIQAEAVLTVANGPLGIIGEGSLLWNNSGAYINGSSGNINIQTSSGGKVYINGKEVQTV